MRRKQEGTEGGKAHLVTGRSGVAKRMGESSGLCSCGFDVIEKTERDSSSDAFTSSRGLPKDSGSWVGVEAVCAWSTVCQ